MYRHAHRTKITLSVSETAHVWGIAPNNSLYVCVKPCSGDWQYVGGSFKQIDDGNNMVIGVTTDNTLIIAAITSVVNERITNESKLPVTVYYEHKVFSNIVQHTLLIEQFLVHFDESSIHAFMHACNL